MIFPLLPPKKKLKIAGYHCQMFLSANSKKLQLKKQQVNKQASSIIKSPILFIYFYRLYRVILIGHMRASGLLHEALLTL